MNDRIRAKEVRLIGSDGSQVGVVSIDEARRMSTEEGLDLLLLSEEATPPVCKLVDFGQFKYELRKKEKLARKGSKAQITKELKMSPKISDHDYNVRFNAGRKFLEKSYSVKLTIFFKGREMAHVEIGRAVLDRYLVDISEYGSQIGDVVRGARTLSVMIAPGGQKKKVAVAEETSKPEASPAKEGESANVKT